MLEAKKLYGLTGGITMSKQTAWFGSWTALTFVAWRIAGKNFMDFLRKRCDMPLPPDFL
jgi:hypothetical protein